jgi:hypothetical protein
MFGFKYLLSVIILSFIYDRSKSQRSYNNWLFDYIKDKDDDKMLKIHGIVYLLLHFRRKGDTESVETCLIVFDEQISKNEKLTKLKKKLLETMDLKL